MNLQEYKTTIIEPDSTRENSLKSLWLYRDLIIYLAWSNVKVRYKQTALGIVWAILQPLTAMLIFTVIFGLFLGVESGDFPYPIYVYSALLAWQYFAAALNDISMSLVNHQQLLTKVFFPRLVVIVSSIFPPLIDLVMASSIYLVLMVIFNQSISWTIIFLPLFLMLAILTAFGFGIWIATLTVKYRDFRYVIQFVLQIWLFASPTVYSISVVPELWLPLYSMNPMVNVIAGFRWALLGTDPPQLLSLIVSILISAIVAISGIYYFRKNERLFSDII